LDDGYKAGACRLAPLLVRKGDAGVLAPAVGVIRAGAAPHAAAVPQQHELDLAARLVAHHLDLRIGCNPRGRHAIEDRRRGRALDAERFELADVLLDRGGVAAGPAGYHRVLDRHVAARRIRAALQGQAQNSARHCGSPAIDSTHAAVPSASTLTKSETA